MRLTPPNCAETTKSDESTGKNTQGALINSMSEIRNFVIKVSVNMVKNDLIKFCNGKPLESNTGMACGVKFDSPLKGQKGLFDSGSNFNLSGCRQDFSKIQQDASVCIIAVDGEVNGGRPVGFVGKFRPNNLGLVYGVFYPDIGPTQRIFSGKALLKCGWEAILNNDFTSRLQGKSSVVPIIWEKDLLPYAGINFLKNNKSQSGAELTPAAPENVLISKKRSHPKIEKLSPQQALALHRAAGHLYIPGLKVECHDCLASKGGRTGHAPQRDPRNVPAEPLAQLNLDFYGKLSPSGQGNNFILVVICDVSSHVWVIPIKTKDEVVERVKELILKLRTTDSKNLYDKVVLSVRSDNEIVLRSRAWKNMLQGLSVNETHSVPYSPQQNGVVERYMRTLGENLSANMIGVDFSVWDFCARYIGWCWNRIPRKNFPRAPRFNGMTPIDAKNTRVFVNQNENVTEIAENKQFETHSLNKKGQPQPDIPNKEFLLWLDPNIKQAGVVQTTSALFTDFDSMCAKILDDANSNFNLLINKTELNCKQKSSDSREESAGAFSTRDSDLTLEFCETNVDELSCASDSESVLSSVFAGRILDLDRKNGPSRATPDQGVKAQRWFRHFRPFGALCFVLKEPRDKVKKGETKYQKAIFLGFSDTNSSWLFGVWAKDKTVSALDGLKFKIIESRSANFTEHKVSDLDLIKQNTGFWKNSGSEESRTLLPCGDREKPVGKQHHQFPEWYPPATAGVDNTGVDTIEVEKGGEAPNPDHTVGTTGSLPVPAVPETAPHLLTTGAQVEHAKNNFPHSGKKRGRPVGATDGVKRVRRTRDELNNDPKYLSKRIPQCSFATCDCEEFIGCAEALDDHAADPLFKAAMASGRYKDEYEYFECNKTVLYRPEIDSEDGLGVTESIRAGVDRLMVPPTALVSALTENDFCLINPHTGVAEIQAKINLSIKKALDSADAPAWRAAIDTEYNKLVKAHTWVDATPDDLRSDTQMIPVGILLTKKRNGAHKCRAVALGNFLDKTGVDVFAPTLSMTAHRILLTKAARDGDYIKCFDIDSAFLNASVDMNLLIKLPENFVKPGEPTVKRLKKALYGLPQAPKAWFQHYANGLKSLGWRQSKNEPSIWRKQSGEVIGRYLKMSVYVDDNIITGPSLPELEKEMRFILAQYAGREIKPELEPNGWQLWDALGAEFRYNRSQRSMKLTMATYIEKLAEKYNVRTTAPDPNFRENDLMAEKFEINFPYREIIGALQWVSTIARPDVTRNINLLSRFLGKPVTLPRVDAAKRIIKYLVLTKNEGIYYSPLNEKFFKAQYAEDGDGQAVPPSEHLLFNDASFAANVDSYYSNSGSVLYVHGTPVAWRSGRQKVRAQSTCEAEWIAAADGLTWVSQVSCLEFFSGKDDNIEAKLPEDLLIMCDNRSAVLVAKTEEVCPKSRHFALRLIRVRDESKRVVYCRTDKMCADALTKAVPGKVRALLLGHLARLPK